MPSSAGFTLVELLVALAIAGLLLALVPAAMQRLFVQAEYRATVRELLVGLKSARQQAMRSGEERTFWVDLEHRRFGMDGTHQGVLPQRLDFHLSALQEQTPTGRRSIIRFYPDGSATGGSIEVRRPAGGGVQLRVDWLLGRVSQLVLRES